MSKILIVEDDVFLRDGLCEILSKENYTVTVASTVSQAKKFIDTDSFNLLIFDVMLPDGNGFDLCMSVREKDSNIPILFFISAFWSADANMYLKPANTTAATASI